MFVHLFVLQDVKDIGLLVLIVDGVAVGFGLFAIEPLKNEVFDTTEFDDATREEEAAVGFGLGALGENKWDEAL